MRKLETKTLSFTQYLCCQTASEGALEDTETAPFPFPFSWSDSANIILNSKGKEWDFACVCVCVWEREKECVCACVCYFWIKNERVCTSVYLSAYLCVYTC